LSAAERSDWRDLSEHRRLNFDERYRHAGIRGCVPGAEWRRGNCPGII
jgi:hypothetical protein